MRRFCSNFMMLLMLACLSFMVSCAIVSMLGLVFLPVFVFVAMIVEIVAIDKRYLGGYYIHRKTLSWFGCVWHVLCAIAFVLFGEFVCESLGANIAKAVLSDPCMVVSILLLVIRIFVVQPLYIHCCNIRRKRRFM